MRKEGIALAAFLALILAAALAIFAAAQEEEAEEFLSEEEELIPESSAGTTPDSPLYVFDKIIDNVQLSLAKGEDKTKKAMEIKEERLAEAAVMVEKKKPEAAKSALELATKAAAQAQQDIAPDLEKETNEKVRRAAKLLSGLQEKLPDQGWEDVEKAIDAQLSEEEKVRVALLVSKSRLSYCDAIAKEDFELMAKDELCQMEKAPTWLKGKIEGDFKEREDKARKQIIDSVSVCIIDPKKCDCSQIPVAKHSQDCEVKKALAIKCEYENDNAACAQLGSEDVEELMPELIGEEGKKTLLEAIRQKEQQMFERFKPPECEATATFEDCFRIMKELYGEPIQCEGLSDDECMEFIKRNPPTEAPNLPPECNEAGVQKPAECAELMFSKYGKPPQCEGLDTRECMKLMRHERPDAMQNAMPKECQDAGATQPRQCFDIMTAKYGMPRECEGLDADACFQEMMKRGPGGSGGPEPGEGAGPMVEEAPECKEKGVRDRDCFLLMSELYGTPPECERISTDECWELVRNRPPLPQGGGGNCIGLSPEECRAKMQEQQGMPPECAQNPEDCMRAFEARGVAEGMPTECAGLDKEQCELGMRRRYAPPECQDKSKEECDAIMREKYEGQGQGGEGRGGFANDCRGLSREECEQTMRNRFGPPECQGTSREECDRAMEEKARAEGIPQASRAEQIGRAEQQRWTEGSQPTTTQPYPSNYPSYPDGEKGSSGSGFESGWRSEGGGGGSWGGEGSQPPAGEAAAPSSGSEGGGTPAPSPEPSVAAAITGQIIRAMKWIGGN